jgi:hypothetical protein
MFLKNNNKSKTLSFSKITGNFLSLFPGKSRVYKKFDVCLLYDEGG